MNIDALFVALVVVNAAFVGYRVWVGYGRRRRGWGG